MAWKFYGRQEQLELLGATIAQGRWFFYRVQGRRRIGKSELLRQLALPDHGLDERLVYLQIPDSDERDVVRSFRSALEDSPRASIRERAASATNFLSMSRVISQLWIHEKAIVILDEFQYFTRKGLEPFLSHLQAVVDKQRENPRGGGGLFVLGSIQSEMVKLLSDDSQPLYQRETHRLNLEHWDFEDLLDVFADQGVIDPRNWLTLWSFFEGVPKFYRDAESAGCFAGLPGSLGERLIRGLFLGSASPLRDEADLWLAHELKGRNVSILSWLADHPGCSAGDLAAGLSDSGNSAEFGSYLANLVSKYHMVDVRQPVFAPKKARSGRYYLADNFLQVCLAVTSPAIRTSRIRPEEFALQRSQPRLFVHEGFMFEKLVRSLHVECSKKGKGDFPVDHMELGFWNRPRDQTKAIEIDVVAINDEERRVRFGSCKRSARAHEHQADVFNGHVERFLKTKEGQKLTGYTQERVLFAPVFEPDDVAQHRRDGFRCMDLNDYAKLLTGP